MHGYEPSADRLAASGVDPRRAEYHDIVRHALRGVRDGDVTTAATVAPSARAHGVFLIKADCVIAGLEVALEAFRQLDPATYAHELGMATVLWCYLRNPKFKTPEGDMHAAADLTGQANHLGVTIQADIIKQKLPERNGGYPAMNALGGSYGKTSDKVYSELTTDNPIDLVRYQVANCYMGRCGLINSGGESKGKGDLAAAVRTAVINKRGGGTGLISGRKAFQRPMNEGVELLNSIQDVYLTKDITIA